MSIVIVGGNDRMIYQYKDLCKKYKCKAKVFTHLPGNFKGQFGCPDLLVLFTSTVSHTMVCSAVQEANKNNTTIVRCHSSSACALKGILEEHCKGCTKKNCKKSVDKKVSAC